MSITERAKGKGEKEIGINRCRRCGGRLESKSDLRCEYCRARVDEEINHETSRPFNWYFTYYQRNRDELHKSR